MTSALLLAITLGCLGLFAFIIYRTYRGDRRDELEQPARRMLDD